LVQISQLAHSQVNQVKLFQDVTTLASDSMEGRKTGTIGNEKARKYILDRVEEIGLKPFASGFELPFKIESNKENVVGINVVGFIPGLNPTKGSVVISAHYDHVGIKAGEIYNGADDNASGVAALLAIAEYFQEHRMQHNLIIAFFDAEEMGLKGAYSFVESHPEDIVLNLNMDMVSRSDSKEIYIAGTYQNPKFKEYIQSAIQANDSLRVLLGHDKPGSGGQDWTNSSDHGPFNKAGIPFLYFGVEDHEDYHKPSDDPEKIDISFFANVVKMIISVTNSMDNNLE